MAVIAERAPAKINVTLRVLGRRPDGYHALESLVAFADASDRLTLDPSRPDGLSVAGPAAAGIVGENLLTRVLAEAQRLTPDLAFGHLHLDKHLPVAAGIGGGSADAAAAVRAILRRHPGEQRLKALATAATNFGADVPACLVARALVMYGTGEVVRPLRHFASVEAVLVNPRRPLATASVFKALEAAPVADGSELYWPGEIEGLDALLATIGDRPNDLERPARQLMPPISEMLSALSALPGCRLARMSGSGPTCYGLFDKAAAAAAAELARAEPGWWVTAARLT
jgi:4-diphosphocytidyl-2-C-methyl-D-erythritol kinase